MADLLAVDADDADQLVVLEHRHAEEGACAAELGERATASDRRRDRASRLDVVDLHDLLGSRPLGQGRSAGRDGLPDARRMIR